MTNFISSEKTIDKREVFQGRIIHLETHTVELPNGRHAEREVVRHPGAVAILGEPDPSHLLFVKQFRKAPEEILWEIPAGKMDPGESPEVCAQRELHEETGFTAGSVELVYEFFTSPGFADEKIDLYYARDLKPGEQNPDEDEFVEVYNFSIEEIQTLLAEQKIRDAKTLIGVLWWLNKKGASV